ncbi:hypothetical protein M8C21_031613 [Ambrosia artemisiifolia]|uniref:Uncharacterized protein n=1 Tax=Ambrosia artemisiifolia TaxID=4212 RepID=A0AAD5CAR5_AMBAR|nr:hypothetical protein M8C21_031613 [Ambrosia artemisiifolia]
MASIVQRVSETGQPNEEDFNQHGASKKNAAKYNQNVIRKRGKAIAGMRQPHEGDLNQHGT